MKLSFLGAEYAKLKKMHWQAVAKPARHLFMQMQIFLCL